MESLMAVSVAVIAAVYVLLLVFLVPVLFQIRRTAKEAGKLIDSVRVEVGPISHDVRVIAKDVRGITNSVHRQVEQIEDGVEGLHEFTAKVRRVQDVLWPEVERSLVQIGSTLAGMRRGIESVTRLFGR